MTERSIATLKLEARVLSAATTRALDWVDEHRGTEPLIRHALTRELRHGLGVAAEVARAADHGSAIAVLSASPAFADRLVAALTRPRDTGTLARFQGSHTRLPVVRGLLPDGDTLGLAVPVRLTRETGGEPGWRLADAPPIGAESEDPLRRRGPETAIRADLLSLADLIVLLAGAALTHVRVDARVTWADGVRREQPQRLHLGIAEAVDRVVREVAAEPTAAVQPGLTDADIDGVRAALEAAHPGHPRLGALAAAGYWSAFATLAPRIGTVGRRRLAALLWDGLADFDALFGDLIGALENLSFASEVIVPAEAVRDPASGPGWGRAHPSSVLAAATVLTSNDSAPGALAVRTRFGPEIQLPRRLLALLLAGVTLTIEGDAQAALGEADVLLLPTACPDVAPRGSQSDLALRRQEDSPWLDRAILQTKTVAALRRTVRRHEASTLVVHLDAARSLSHGLAPVLSEWVSVTHGRSAAERETAETTLFLAIGAARGGAPGSSGGSDWRGLADFLSGFGAEDRWLDRWGVDQPFDNVFLLGDDTEPGSAPGRTGEGLPAVTGQATRFGALTAATEPESDNLWRRHVRNADVALDEALHTPDRGLRFLAQSITSLAHERVRRRQLTTVLTVAVERTRMALQRTIESPSLSGDGDWRSRTALATVARMRPRLQDSGLGALIDCLSLRESEAAIVFDQVLLQRGRQHAARIDSVGDIGGLVDRLDQAAPLDDVAATKMVQAYAKAVMGHWADHVYAVSQAAETASRVGVASSALQQIAAELLAAAVRVGVMDRIAARLLEVVRRRPLPPGQWRGAATLYAVEGINAFICHLGFDSPWSATHPRRRGTLGAPLFDRVSAASAEAVVNLDARRIAHQYGTDWTDAYLALVDANLASSRGMRFEDGTHREIEEILALLGARPRDFVS